MTERGMPGICKAGTTPSWEASYSLTLEKHSDETMLLEWLPMRECEGPGGQGAQPLPSWGHDRDPKPPCGKTVPGYPFLCHSLRPTSKGPFDARATCLPHTGLGPQVGHWAQVHGSLPHPGPGLVKGSLCSR